ncbi:hypothetical protein AALO_G00152420 [Alosa alosa]|uniref:Uncharacterized protein n=1 Tax=Alosa alosa TaxID=278164 RepID=A0AAV6GEE1_9TELE|nr:hypothetical protein AALO_G00152420 [Alosa alosa]
MTFISREPHSGLGSQTLPVITGHRTPSTSTHSTVHHNQRTASSKEPTQGYKSSSHLKEVSGSLTSSSGLNLSFSEKQNTVAL